MHEDLNERLVNHRGKLGEAREEILRRFLRKYLPGRFEVSNGFVFDHHGSLSDELDIIISDKLVAPLFETPGGIRHYPCQSVVAVGQVKSSLTSAGELIDALDNLASVKRLDRSAGGKAVDHLSGEKLNHEENYLHQVFTFLIITGRSISKDGALEEYMEYIHTRKAHLWTNIIISLNKYIVTFHCDDGVCPNPMHARGITVVPASENPDLLMKFYVLLGRALEVTRISTLPYWQYLEQYTSWNGYTAHGEIVDSLEGRAPRYLRDLTGQ